MKRDIKSLSEKYAKKIKAAGFSHVKVELEADLGRRDIIGETITCEECQGSGVNQQIDAFGDQSFTRCVGCSGRGGSSTTLNFRHTDFCEEWLKDQLPEDLRDKFNFFYFYRDGSVDSELTFTLPVEYMHRVIDVIEAWKKLAEVNDNGMDTDGAGMHIAILKEGTYPCSATLDTENLRNFTTEVTKLLPSLILLGTENERTRPLQQYRAPQIGSSKYSSIHILRGGFEYRLFDTCYEKPETFIVYMGAIAKTLEYYAKPDKKVVANANMSYQFHETNYKTMSLVDDEDKIKYIKQTFKHVKPSEYTVKELMEQRGVTVSLTQFRKENSHRLARLNKMYKEYRKTQESKVVQPANEYELNSIKYYRDNKALETLSDKEILLLLRGMPDIEEKTKWMDRNAHSQRGARLSKVNL